MRSVGPNAGGAKDADGPNAGEAKDAGGPNAEEPEPHWITSRRALTGFKGVSKDNRSERANAANLQQRVQLRV